MIERRKFRRLRGTKIFPTHITTDGHGGIVRSPLHYLECLGDPEEYYWGFFDRPYFVAYKEKPLGCALCLSKPACGIIVLERINTDVELAHLFAEWERQTQRLPGKEAYEHASWSEYVLACRERTWPNSNIAAQIAEKTRKAAHKKAKRTAESKARKRRPRKVSVEVRDWIALERDRLQSAIMAIKTTPKAPPWIAKLPPERCVFTADVWQACEMLDEPGQKVTARAAVKWLKDNARIPIDAPEAIVQRVNEARRRLDLITREGIWNPSDLQDPIPNIGQPRNSNTVTEVLDD